MLVLSAVYLSGGFEVDRLFETQRILVVFLDHAELNCPPLLGRSFVKTVVGLCMRLLISVGQMHPCQILSIEYGDQGEISHFAENGRLRWGGQPFLPDGTRKMGSPKVADSF